MTSTGKEEIVLSSQVQTIERDTGAAKPATPANPAAPATETPKAILPAKGDVPEAQPTYKPGVPKAAVITLGDGRAGKDMVGIYMTAHQLEQALPMLKEDLGTDGSGVVVFRITSGGGYGSEVQKISDIIYNEYNRHFRTVAWIDSAISAAAMSAHCMREIYFTPQGNYGACTGFYGSLDRPVEGIELQKSLTQMERISTRGGYDPLIMRAMQVQQPLSASPDPDDPTGRKFIWFPDSTSGKILVNRPGEILTFNERTALQVGFSKGTASTIQELTKLMGYQELNWIGKEVRGVPWPVSRAEQWSLRYRDQVAQDEARIGEYWTRYQMAIQAAQGAPREERGKFVTRARLALDQIKNMVRNNPNFRVFILNMTEEEQYKEWLEQQEKLLRDLLR